jgi:anhydro-N-acetylmuramic acid kinase
MAKFYYSLGFMSGTSLDGVDASIIKSDGENYVEIIDNKYIKYNDKLRSKLVKIVDYCTSRVKFNKLLQNIREVEKEVTIVHEKLFRKIIRNNSKIKIDFIGFHGQTILHKPQNGYSIQIGDSKLLSRLTKTKVVSNFRENDIINGGQGAPLAPLYHKLILSKTRLKFPLAIVNIGGISNITYFKNKNKIISFDTGPGNYLLDKWVKKNTGKNFDKNGFFSKTGKVNKKILNKLLKNPYYKKKIPKSLDVKNYDLKSIEKLSFKDGCATLSMLTIQTICSAIKKIDKDTCMLLVSGGGRKNKFIFNNLKKKLNISVDVVDKYNFDGDYIESQAFAYLAIRSYLKKFITLPSTTGVSKPCLGGSLFLN